MAAADELGGIETQTMDFRFRGNGGETPGEGMDFVEAAVDQGQAGRLLQGTLGGDRLPGSSARPEDDAVRFAKCDAERLGDCSRETGAVGVVPHRLAFAKNHRVHGTKHRCFVGDICARGHSLELVRHGDVAADEAEFSHRLKSFREPPWLDLQTHVRNAGPKRVQRRLM